MKQKKVLKNGIKMQKKALVTLPHQFVCCASPKPGMKEEGKCYMLASAFRDRLIIDFI
jgi:hypothetical protein